MVQDPDPQVPAAPQGDAMRGGHERGEYGAHATVPGQEPAHDPAWNDRGASQAPGDRIDPPSARPVQAAGEAQPPQDGGDDRGFVERAGDEVRSWFGDEAAERRRTADARHGMDGAGD